MPVSISSTIPSININGNTYDHADWENNTPGTISGIANDISSRQILLELVGVLTKSISGNTTLTGPESTNIGFVFVGALTMDVSINFAAGFEGIAVIENQTTGGFELSCGLAAGQRVTVPTLGSTAALCDGTNFKLQSGAVRTNGGSNISGTLDVEGAATVGGTMVVTGAASFSSTLGVVGNLSTNGNLVVDDNFTAVGTGAFGGLVSLADGLIITATGTDILLIMSTVDGEAIWQNFATAGFARWLVGKSDTLESGANVGSDFHIVRHNDGGTAIAIPFKIKRSNGNIILEELPISASGLGTGTVWNDSGTLKIV